jgi:hypothetical protein
LFFCYGWNGFVCEDLLDGWVGLPWQFLMGTYLRCFTLGIFEIEDKIRH